MLRLGRTLWNVILRGLWAKISGFCHLEEGGEVILRFLPFGGGRRGYPGFSFGLATVEISLARLLFHFDWSLLQGQGAADVDLTEIFGLATRKRSALKLIPTTNSDHPIQSNVTQRRSF